MGLNKVKIKELVTLVEERNTFGYQKFYGINKDKEYMPTVADITNVDPKKYKVIRKGRFVYSGMQTGRDNCIRVGMYFGEEPILVSPAYTTFEVTNTKMVIPEYFHMIFLSKEKDRFGSFLSDGSIRANLDWPVFCDIELLLPSVSIQQKYVDIYKGMVENQKAYERGLEDLKLVCDATIEKIRALNPVSISNNIIEVEEKNTKSLAKEEMGISIKKEFIVTKAKSSDIEKQKIVKPSWFAYNTNTSRNGDSISIALNDTKEIFAVSNTYCVFKCSKDLLPEYLILWFKRKEFDRFSRYRSWGSARETIDIEEIKDYQISIPSIEVQQSLINIYKVLGSRSFVNEKLKTNLKDICPILIKGSIEEALKEA